MHVYLGRCVFDSVQYPEVGLAGVARMYSTLHADFGCAAVPCFTSAPLYFLETQVVRSTTQIFRGLALRECAELAMKVAEVRVVNIAIDRIRAAPRR